MYYWVLELVDVWLIFEGNHRIPLIRKLFPSTHVYVKMIFDEIQKRRNDVNVDDLYKLYVLLGLSEFLLPTVSGSVFRWFI